MYNFEGRGADLRGRAVSNKKEDRISLVKDDDLYFGVKHPVGCRRVVMGVLFIQPTKVVFS